jgi:hypothetical protein
MKINGVTYEVAWFTAYDKDGTPIHVQVPVVAPRSGDRGVEWDKYVRPFIRTDGGDTPKQ